MKPCLIFSGFYAVGKTSIGMEVANRLEIPFVDIDHLFHKHFNKTSREFWKERGEEAFRECESQILALLDSTPSVISLGGGTLLLEKNRSKLLSIGSIIYLKANLETLLSRIEKKGYPVFYRSKEEFEKLALDRFQIYESTCHIIIETDYMAENEIVKYICDAYGK